MSTSLCGIFDNVLLSWHKPILDGIYFLQLVICQGPSCLKQYIRSFSGCNGIKTHDHLFCKETLNHLAERSKYLTWIVSTSLNGAFKGMFYHIATLCCCLNLKERLAQSRCYIWHLSECNVIRTQIHLFFVQRINSPHD